MTNSRLVRALRTIVVLCATVVFVCPAPAAAPPPPQTSNKVEFDVPKNVKVRIVASWNETGKPKFDREYRVRVERKSAGPNKEKFNKKKKKGGPDDKYHDVSTAETWEAFVEYDNADPIALTGKKFPLVDGTEIYGVVIVFDAEDPDERGKSLGSGTFTTPVGIMILYNPN